VNLWNNSAGMDHQRLEMRKEELFAARSQTPESLPAIEQPQRRLGRVGQWWSDRPVLSVAAMFVAPIAALLLFMAVY
jgi:hypothetical protein